MQIFYAPDIIGPEYVLTPDESLHAVRVLRLGTGARVNLVDGSGTMYEALVVHADPRHCVVKIDTSIPGFAARPYRLTMGVAPTKNNERMEWLLEKATEVGLDGFIPLECANSERKVFFKHERARKVMVSAMKQSLKAVLPTLEPMTPVREVFNRPFEGVKLIAHCREDSPRARVSITDALPSGGDVLILIGPEGDFSAGEVESALENGFIPVSLGTSRLRTETAALAATTAVYLKNL